MPFINYLKTKRKFLIVWCTLHALAWFLNTNEIEGDVYSNWTTTPTMWGGTIDVTGVNLWTDNSTEKEEHFWPFVKFISRGEMTRYNGSYRWEQSYFRFQGLFFEYDFSEFLAYVLLSFGWIYFRFVSKNPLKQTPTNHTD